MIAFILSATLSSPLNAVLADIRALGASLDSDGLLSLVTGHFAGRSLQREQHVIETLLSAWDDMRDVPEVNVDAVVAALSLRRDAVRTLDVVYHASLFIDPAAAGPLQRDFEVGGGRTWWARWTRTPSGVRRLAAPDLRTLLDEGPAHAIVSAGCDGQGAWMLRGDGALSRATSSGCDGGRVLGLEGPWMGAGMMASDASRGMAVVPSHDAAHWIESLGPGAAVVEHDGPLLRVRVGWTSPCFIWVDPQDDLAVHRVVRRWWEGDVEMELETTPSAWVPTESGVEVPTRIHVVQRIRSSGLPPIMELDLRALKLRAGDPVEPALLRPP